VLLLGDTDAETQVQAALEAAGHTVTFGGVYYDWDGVTPNVTGFDVVVLLNAYDYGYPLQATAATALQAFVAAGGGLVLTEWTAYDVCSGYKGAIVDALMPVTMPDCSDYGDDDTWTVDILGHPLVAGLPSSWTDAAGWSTVTTKPGATVVVSGTAGNPMVVYWSAPGGTVVYINHDLTYTTSPISAEGIQLIINAAGYASAAAAAAGAAVPTLSAWGILVAVLSLAIAAVWSLRRLGS
jgi:hypothetical protein